MNDQHAALRQLAKDLGGAPPLGTCDDTAADELAAAFSRLPASESTEVWRTWLDGLSYDPSSEDFIRHMAVARASARLPSLSDDQIKLLVEMALTYPDPSYNRYFVQAALCQLGMDRLLGEYRRFIDRGQVGPDELDKALYWTHYSAEDLSGARSLSWRQRLGLHVAKRRLRRAARRRGRTAG